MKQRFKLGGQDHVNKENRHAQRKKEFAKSLVHLFSLSGNLHGISRRKLVVIDYFPDILGNTAQITTDKPGRNRDDPLLVFPADTDRSLHGNKRSYFS